MQQEMHSSKSVQTGGQIIEHNSRSTWNRLKVLHGRRLQNVEGTKNYKTREKS